MGRFSEQKNPLFIVEVLKELKKIRKDFHFDWIGDGQMKLEVEEMAIRKGLQEEISFLGIRNDINLLLCKSEYFLFPSLFEGLPITLLEAQCCGLECFVSDTVSREVDLGLCYYLSLEKGPKEWAQYISDKIDKKSSCILNKKKLELFDVKNTVRRLEKIYG